MNKKVDDMPRARGIYLLPNLFTIAALFAGFYAVVAAMRGHYDDASISIFVAMVLDSLDGRIARLTNTVTPFGAQLDSLSDMVSFGVAPALVVYSWSLIHLGKVGWLTAFIYAVAVGLRLARFNIDVDDSSSKRYFHGLPCPAGAGLLAGLVWFMSETEVSGISIDILVAVFTVVAGLLMVSSIKYRSFKDINLKNYVPFIAVVAVVLVFVLISIDPPKVLFSIFLLYALSGPIMWLWRRWF